MIKLKSCEDFHKIITKKGFSKRALAERSGLSVSTLVQISNGKQSPRPHTAKKICEALNMSFDDVFVISGIKAVG